MVNDSQMRTYRAGVASLSEAKQLYGRIRGIGNYIQMTALDDTDIRALIVYQEHLMDYAEEAMEKATSLFSNFATAFVEPEDLPF